MIVLRRLDAIISFGDLIIAFGLVDATYWASRRTRRSRAGIPLRGPEVAAGDGPDEMAASFADERFAEDLFAEDLGTDELGTDAPRVTSSRKPPAKPAAKPQSEPDTEPAHAYVAPTGMGRGPAPRRSTARRSTTSRATVAIKETLERFERP